MVDFLGFYYEKYRPSEKIVRVRKFHLLFYKPKTIPFNSRRKKMITIVREEGKIFVYVKGASEFIL